MAKGCSDHLVETKVIAVINTQGENNDCTQFTQVGNCKETY